MGALRGGWVGSRFRGNDVGSWGSGETGLAPRLWHYRAEWIPAYAGVTVLGGGHGADAEDAASLGLTRRKGMW